MHPEAKKRFFYTLRDPLHVLAEQYARSAFRLAIHSKRKAIKALNLANERQAYPRLPSRRISIGESGPRKRRQRELTAGSD